MTREGTDDWPIRITSERLMIREGRDEDRATVIRLMTDPVTREYLGGAIDHASRQALDLSPLGLTWGSWVIAESTADRMIGSITLGYDRGELEISYALLPEYTGQGYAAEACHTLLSWAQENLEDERVIAVTQTRNKRSVSLLKRLGFTVRHGLEEFGSQQLLLERPLSASLPHPRELAPSPGDPPPPRPH